MSGAGHRLRFAAVASTVLSTVALVIFGMWAHAATRPLWPDMLSDWSLGSSLFAMSSAGVGAVVLWRQPRNRIGLLFTVQALLTAAVFGLRWYATYATGPAGPGTAARVWSVWLFTSLIPVNMTLLSLLALLYPFGTPPSARWRPAVWFVSGAGVLIAAANAFSPYVSAQSPFPDVTNPLALIPPGMAQSVVDNANTLSLVSLALGAASLVQRLRRARGDERQQVKWFVFAVCAAVPTFIVGFWFPPLFVFATVVALPSLPVAAGLAVLKYRLYDIDRIISRTVTYAVVTAGLLALYAGSVVAARTLLPVTGDAPLAVAASTLAAAAAFQPLRRSVQARVDRRFNRARYDAQSTAAAYRARLRDELDLESIASDLLGVTTAVMQPRAALLWLREVAT